MEKKGDLFPFTVNDNDLSVLSDDELISLIRNGCEKALNTIIDRYSDAVTAVSGKYFSDSLTRDDWFQEGMLGFLFAVSSFSQEKSASFATYSSVCVRNRLNSVWKNANSIKNAPLNDSVFFDESSFISVESPEDNYIKNEEMNLFEQKYSDFLSEKEKTVVLLYLSDFSYDQIAKQTGLSKKSVDNAIFRARQKLQKLYQK